MDKWDPKWNTTSWKGYDNYWAGAKKACDDIGMSLPKGTKLQSLAKKTKAEKEQLGLPTSGWFWSSSEITVGIGGTVDFGGGNVTHYKFDSYGKVLCVGD